MSSPSLDWDGQDERPCRGPETGAAGQRETARCPGFEWTIVTAEGDVAAHLERAQALAIKEVLEWVSQQPPSLSMSSPPAPGATDAEG
ncbi:hypothetical protein [Actinomadura geliboluensis]|uniref:hypothetical protein n=1 Tax=Actinomadura geliboluensis TaxID=882440 RepID=UPI002610B51F|nr:hypothetical protein [Actinomadura geliboluensis]